MSWTSIDIRRQRFRRRWRGYDPEEVNMFLHVIAEEIERLNHTIRHLEHENTNLSEQLEDLMEKERYIRNTLVAVQQTRDRLKEEAEREADLCIREAEHQRDRILEAARKELDTLYNNIELLNLEYHRLQDRILAEASALTRWIQQRREAEARETKNARVTMIPKVKNSTGSG